MVLEKDGEEQLDIVCVRNEEELHKVNEDDSNLHTIKIRKANWIGHILRRSALLKHIIEGKMEAGKEVTGRQERRDKQLLGDLQKTREKWKLNQDALDRNLENSLRSKLQTPELWYLSILHPNTKFLVACII
jgi:hypothetical protein